jgi:hypothetical protein
MPRRPARWAASGCGCWGAPTGRISAGAAAAQSSCSSQRRDPEVPVIWILFAHRVTQGARAPRHTRAGEGCPSMRRIWAGDSSDVSCSAHAVAADPCEQVEGARGRCSNRRYALVMGRLSGSRLSKNPLLAARCRAGPAGATASITRSGARPGIGQSGRRRTHVGSLSGRFQNRFIWLSRWRVSKFSIASVTS